MPARRAIKVACSLLVLAGGALVLTAHTMPVAAAESPAAAQNFLIEGALEQGGWIRGKAPARTVRLRLGNTALPIDAEGRFFAAFDRDAAPFAELLATLSDGTAISAPLTVAPREWQIERINVARTASAPSESFMAIRRPELERIAAARSVGAESQGWAQKFIWPVKGRISGRFGSQRIYRGEPAAYHSGLDIATGTSGTPFVAPADGVVTLAATTPFSLEGYLLIIDHGNGLNSAFLHCSDIVVREGEVVRQGQHIGNIGATGRATGPHLHWSMKWHDARLDPLLFTGPMN
jgi:murein DD-endopeptidase MepM/ murein hydrolase activator NlpD